MEILFSKYNRNRLPKYQLATYIIKEKNKIFASKTPLLPEANQHILNIFSNYNKLRTQYNTLNLAGIELKGNRLLFEYIEGASLDIILFNYIKNNDIDAFHSTVQSYIGYLKSLGTVTHVSNINTEFEVVFGIQPEFSDTEYLEIANIDLTFENLIVHDRFFIGIDYEWVFDFPIPLDYIIFRSMNMFYWKFGDYLHHFMPIEDMYKKYSIKYADVYSEMEKGFQKYVLGEDINEKYLKSAKHLNDLVLENMNSNKHISSLKNDLVQIVHENEKNALKLAKETEEKVQEKAAEKEKITKELTTTIKEKESIILKQNLDLQHLNMEISSKNLLINEKESTIESLKIQNLDLRNQIELLDQRIFNEISSIIEKKKNTNFVQNIISYFNKSFKEAEREISTLRILIEQLEIENKVNKNSLDIQKKEYDGILTGLRKELQSLKELYNEKLLEKNQIEARFNELARKHHYDILELNHLKDLHHQIVHEKRHLEDSLHDLEIKYHEAYMKLNKL